MSKIGEDDRVSKHRPDPKVGKEPAPSRHRSPILSQTVRGNRLKMLTLMADMRPESTHKGDEALWVKLGECLANTARLTVSGS